MFRRRSGSDASEKQCRVCFDGPDPELGRLIKPCLCKGSVKYIHVNCLNRWRTTSKSKNAFYSCPQCRYQYRFQRTIAYGLATNPLVVGTVSTIFFIILLYLASFIATFFLDNLDESSSSLYENSYWFGLYGPSPFAIAKDTIRMVLRVILDKDTFPEANSFARISFPSITSPNERGHLANFIFRLLIGFPVIGATALVHYLWTLSMMTPFHYLARLRGRSRRDGRRSGDYTTILVLFAVLLGVLRALYGVYRLTERVAKFFLLTAEVAILEVNN